MGINTPSDIEAELSIGATDQKMVRIFVVTETQEIPMDFLPEEAEEIARESHRRRRCPQKLEFPRFIGSSFSLLFAARNPIFRK